MESADWTQFLSLVREADEAVGARSVRGDKAIALMFSSIAEYSLDEVREAVIKFLRKSDRKVITAADIVSAIDGDVKIRSAVAWRLFLSAVRRYGYFRSVRFPNPAYHYVISQIGGDERRGWQHVCDNYRDLSEHELSFLEKDWRELYEVGLYVATWGDEIGKIKVLMYLPGYGENKRIAGSHEVIDVSSGKVLQRDALTAPSESRAIGD